MKTWAWVLAAAIGMAGWTQAGFGDTPPERGKYLIILQAGKETHEGTARAVHAFLYARELNEHGHDVKLIFDGAGTEWIEEVTDPASESKVKPVYEEFRRLGGVEVLICDFCAGAFGVKEDLRERDLPLVAEYAGHPSIAKWAGQGYEILIL